MTDGDNNMPEWDDESAAICEAMKNDGIELFSVAFDAPKGNGKAKGHCTGKDKEKMEEEKSQYYFDASDSKAFTKAFDEIGESIAQVYIRLL